LFDNSYQKKHDKLVPIFGAKLKNRRQFCRRTKRKMMHISLPKLQVYIYIYIYRVRDEMLPLSFLLVGLPGVIRLGFAESSC